MAGETRDTDAVRIVRTLAASPADVWRMWTEPEQFAAWYGPDGARVSVVEFDLRVGGRRLISMEMPAPDGPRTMWLAGEHLAIAEHEHLAYSEWMSDEGGEVLSPGDSGMPAGAPAVTEVSIQLEELDGETRLTLIHAGVPADSPGATGWAMALAKLAGRLAA